MTDLLRFSSKPALKNPSLVIGWNADASKLGSRVTGYLNRKLGGQAFCEIEPVDFFPLGGVTIEDNIAQFPESTFHACVNNDLLLFESTPPSFEWFKFFNLVLDVADAHCHVRELFTVGGMVSLGAHTAPRSLMATFNSQATKDSAATEGMTAEWDYETPAGQRPTLNSFLLWAAKRRNIPGATIWVPVPFYLVPVEDPAAQKKVLEYFDRRFRLGLDFSDLNAEVAGQNEKLAQLRAGDHEVDESIKKLESNLTLSPEENQKLATSVEKALSH